MPLERSPRQLFAAHVHHADGRRRPARRCPSLLILILQVGLVAMLPLAAASLPDPLWIGGVYDAADYDDLVALCVDIGSSGAPLSGLPSLPPVGVLVVADTVDTSCESRSALQIRSPPSL